MISVQWSLSIERTCLERFLRLKPLNPNFRSMESFQAHYLVGVCVDGIGKYSQESLEVRRLQWIPHCTHDREKVVLGDAPAPPEVKLSKGQDLGFRVKLYSSNVLRLGGFQFSGACAGLFSSLGLRVEG
jgi:hypothetical protein